jgi:aldose 1-epimerase
MPDGRDVRAHTLRVAGGPELTVLDLGATVHRLRVPTETGLVDLVLGYSTVQAYLSPTSGYLGGTVGRYANRIADGTFSLDGTTHALAANEGTTCLHGGTEGFHAKVWQVVDATHDAITLELTSPDGDQGFPGNLRARATYLVAADGVSIELTATCDQPTVVSLTNHSYFNLAGTGRATIDDHLLTVEADHYLPVDDRGIPSQGLRPVDGTPFDFREAATVGPRVRAGEAQVSGVQGIDHAFHLSGAGLRRAARLEHPASGRFLEVLTDQPSLQVYTGNHFDGTVQGRDGALLRQGDGIALETQHHPDAPNQSDFPSAVIRPGDTYRSLTRWRLGTTA